MKGSPNYFNAHGTSPIQINKSDLKSARIQMNKDVK